MQFLKVGHFTKTTDLTGISVFLFDRPARGTYLLCGSAPASHEIAPLELDATVSFTDGLMFAGGSAFGLNAVAGVMQWFKEQGRGYQTGFANIPIVPAAGIYDLSVIKQKKPPLAEEAYFACQNAHENNFLQGRVGAGTGAVVGKLIPGAYKMEGGLGCATLTLKNGVSVTAYTVVNSLGDIRDASGHIIAGACFTKDIFANCETYLLNGQETPIEMVANTTLVALFTNAAFNKMELRRIAKVAMSGMARAISPVFTRFDGDKLFCFSLGNYEASETTIGTMGAEAIRQAIVNAVQNAKLVEF